MQFRLPALLATMIISFSSCYIIKAYKVKDFKLTDHQTMPFVELHASAEPYPFLEAGQLPQYSSLKAHLDSNLERSHTAAFLVIRNDSIIYENYFNGFGKESLLPSFSVVKSFVATLVGIAIGEGKIKSDNDPITAYLPELLKTDPGYAKITLRHLLDMKSGLKFDEGSYGMKDDAIKLAFRPNLLKHVMKVKTEKEPGTFNYQSINTELLALAVERATGKKITAYMQEKLWSPMGAEYGATWNVDSKKRKQEIAFAGLNATARDFAKLGRLYLAGGSWNGKQLVPSSWIDQTMNPNNILNAGAYKNQWWHAASFMYTRDSMEAVAFKNNHRYSSRVFRSTFKIKDSSIVAQPVFQYTVAYNPAPHATGILNQYIYVFPGNNVVIVRLGRNWYHPRKHTKAFIYEIGSAL